MLHLLELARFCLASISAYDRYFVDVIFNALSWCLNAYRLVEFAAACRRACYLGFGFALCLSSAFNLHYLTLLSCISHFSCLAEMVLRAPFVRWACIKNPSPTSPRAALFYLETAEGNRVSCALAIRGPTNRITYTALGAFVDEYHEILPLGGVVRWRFRSIFGQWLDGLLYHSFLLCSEEGVNNAWHLNYVVPAETAKWPSCLLPADGTSTWIVLRHGFRAWPVEIINFEFCEGWDTFCKVHALHVEFKVIMSCERKWIFHTAIIDQNDRELVFQWSGPNPQWREFHAPPVNLRTACLPSAVAKQQTMLKFGFWYLPGQMLRVECEALLNEVFHVFDLEDMVIHMADRTWEIKIQDLKLDVAEFEQFWSALNMQLLDYLLIIMLPNAEFQVIVFDTDNEIEKMYAWF
ncbi:hypothetical protein RHSIM_Rhsim10G0059000 [Rhododendron simsii]|uniref:Uncharacterized protein n=1 Tax=Rhododendron simsii TaxID=118357 RepID=A0A834LCS1_RHOSS|nr:hypothetical protein RHSIM_Rhsim10G0059000 [Rhododendron simsii]